MVLQVKMYGTGTPSDPFVVHLPTYRLILGNIATMTALVLVPTEVHGLTQADLAALPFTATTDGLWYAALPQVLLDKAKAYLDGRYKERAGQFALEVV